MKKIALATPAVAALLLAGCSSGSDDAVSPTASAMEQSPTAPEESPEAMEESPEAMEESADAAEETTEAMADGGKYVPESKFRADPAAFESGNTVLFFYAAWCPDCQRTDSSIQETGVPEDINIVKVDYDNANDLRKKYGVTQQHTYVLIGPGGEQLKKWTGSYTAEDIASKAT
jgi:thiol-disulfide isomerase/thioredoxin